MSLILTAIRGTGGLIFTSNANRVAAARCLFLSSSLRDEEIEGGSETSKKTVDPEKDRSNPHSPETSVRYLASSAYKTTYGNDPVWKQYRRNHKGAIAPKKTRKTCVRNGVISTGNPCPICRDEYLILDHKNPELLKQFISEQNGDVISYEKTGICQRKHQQLLVAIARAKDYGTITFDVPFRKYDYSEWYKPEPKA